MTVEEKYTQVMNGAAQFVSTTQQGRGTGLYEQKVEHVKVVAQRGVDARKQFDEGGRRLPRWSRRERRRQATAVYEAMAIRHPSAVGGMHVLALPDTPADAGGAVVRVEWASHVREVFVASFLAGEPRPIPPGS